MCLVKVFGVIYFAAVCASEDPGDVTFMYEDTYPTSPPPTTPFEPPVPTLGIFPSWLDVFPSEKVEFTCRVNSSSDWTFTWYRNRQQVKEHEDPNVSFSAHGSMLTITASSRAHSGNYVCKGHDQSGRETTESNTLELTVYPNKPKPRVVTNPTFQKMFPGESVTFQCLVIESSGWDYRWYHNGKEIEASNNPIHTIVSADLSDSGEYHCTATRGTFNTQSETTTLQVAEPPTPTVKLQTSWYQVFQNEPVALRCEVDSPTWTFTWHRNGEELHEDSVLILSDDGLYLNITSASLIHQGSYACRAQLRPRNVTSAFSSTAIVTVYGNTPKPLLNKDPAFDPMYVGETVTFTCNVPKGSDWKYRWYRDGTQLLASNKSLSIHLGSADGGTYWCKATRGERTLTDNSDGISQDVLAIPAPSLTRITPWVDVFPTESVKLSCAVQGSSGWTYTWHRDGQEVPSDGTSATLAIHSASALDAGEYKCQGHLSRRSVSSSFSPGLSLIVYDRKPSVILTKDPEYKLMFAGESASFSCSVNVSYGWEYIWYKDQIQLANTLNRTVISPIGMADRGSYTCQAKRGKDKVLSTEPHLAILLDVAEKKPKPLMTQQPDVDLVYTGETVSFTCEVTISSGWKYLWYKDGQLLPISKTRLEIHNASFMNNGIYTCVAIRDKTKFTTEHSDGRRLNISDIPAPSLNQITQWLDVFPTENVVLSCGMETSTQWTYSWYRDGQKIQGDDTVTFDPDGAFLTISSASDQNRGQYSCSGKLEGRSVVSSRSSGLTVDVYDRIPSLVLIQNPEHSFMHTGDSVSFSCHINVSYGWNYLWFRDGSPLTGSGNNYTIRSVGTADAGSYQCQAARETGVGGSFRTNTSPALKLHVDERPAAEIILLTGWSEVFSTDSLVLKCEVKGSQDMWNYTWYKEGKTISLSTSEKHTVTPHNDPEQSQYTCHGVRSERPLYSKESQLFKTKNLLLKRRVLLSISGCLFFGIVAVFLGCIFLRVTRKPVEEDMRPDEAELFLTMAQLKDRADAPSPLVDYITDEALNAPAKDEDSVVKSETTPLPIHSAEDQAGSTEDDDRSETNGGLVSFKQ